VFFLSVLDVNTLVFFQKNQKEEEKENTQNSGKGNRNQIDRTGFPMAKLQTARNMDPKRKQTKNHSALRQKSSCSWIKGSHERKTSVKVTERRKIP